MTMTMKWWNFKTMFVVFLLSITPMLLMAKENKEERYEKRIENYQTQWQKLIPRYTKIQFAGNMGLLSFGTGWDYAKHWETDVFLGFVPKYSTDKTKITFTAKQNYIPWNIDIKNKRTFFFEPLTCGMYVNTVFGGDFWTKEPDKYPSGYYNFSTKVRFNIFLGQRITYKIDKSKRFFAKSITFFYEVNTNDLYIVSAFTNSYLTPKDYLTLSFGLKLQIL